MSDINVTVETKPALTTEQLESAFEEAGDEAFHDVIEDVEISGEAPAKVAPGNIDVTLDTREGGRVEGMITEIDWYLQAVLSRWTREVVQLSACRVPDMSDEDCPDPRCEGTLDETPKEVPGVYCEDCNELW